MTDRVTQGKERAEASVNQSLACSPVLLCTVRLLCAGSTGEIRIGDFGLSVARHATHVESVLGTPEFMAPELYDEKYSELVDVYAFGMCVLEMATKEYPYQECSNAAQIWKRVSTGQKPEVLERIRDCSLRAFIECCLSPESSRLTAAEMLEHPFLSFRRSDPFRDSLVVAVDAKGGVVVGKGGAREAEEAERLLKEVEREGKRRELEEEALMRESIEETRSASSSFTRPQPIDTNSEPGDHISPLASPPTQMQVLSPYNSTPSPAPSPHLKRDQSMPTRMPSHHGQPPQSSPTNRQTNNHNHNHHHHQPHHNQQHSDYSHQPPPSIATNRPVSHNAPSAPSPQSAPPADSTHQPAVTAVVLDVDSCIPPVASITLHIHFGESKRRQVRFDYSMKEDSSYQLANEMVRVLHLAEPERMVMLICTALEEKIDPYRRAWAASMKEAVGLTPTAAGAASTGFDNGNAARPHMSAGVHHFPPGAGTPHHHHHHHHHNHNHGHVDGSMHVSNGHMHMLPPSITTSHPMSPYQTHPHSARHTSTSQNRHASPHTSYSAQPTPLAQSRSTAFPHPSASINAGSRPQPLHTQLHHATQAGTLHSAHRSVAGLSMTSSSPELKSRYQTLPYGFQFPPPPVLQQQMAAGKPSPAGSPPAQMHHVAASHQQQQQPGQRPIQRVDATTAGVARGAGSGTLSPVSTTSPSASPSSVAPSFSRRSSMPLQPSSNSTTPPYSSSPVSGSPPVMSPSARPTAILPSAAVAVSTISHNAHAPPPLPASPPTPRILSAVSSASATAPAFNAAAAAKSANSLPHADVWTAHYKTLSVALLKEQVKAKRGAQALQGALDKAELVQMLVDCTPAHEWPADTHKPAAAAAAAAAADGKKSSLDGSATSSISTTTNSSKDSQPPSKTVSRHNSRNETIAANPTPAASQQPVSAATSPPMRPQIATAELSSTAVTSASAPANEWTDLAFDVVSPPKDQSANEESKELHKPTSGSFRDLDPLFASPLAASSPPQPAAKAVIDPLLPNIQLQLTQPLPNSSSVSSLYDLSTLSPLQSLGSPASTSSSSSSSGGAPLPSPASHGVFFADMATVGDEVAGGGS